MLDSLIDYIGEHYIAFVVVAFLLAAALETVRPAVELRQSIVRRWSRNFALGVIDVVAARVIGLFLLVGFAAYFEAHHVGLLNALSVPAGFAILISFLVLDLKQWFFHLAMHRVPWFWRIHRVHHCDSDFDVSTGFRFHPLETVLSQTFQLLVVAVIGIAPEAIVLRALLLSFSNYFTHANTALPDRAERVLRSVLITPALHRIHHSAEPADHHRNFGVIFSFWDRMFRTYRGAAAHGSQHAVGLPSVADSDRLGLFGLLVLPFVSVPSRATARMASAAAAPAEHIADA